jgi:DNA-binding transcriptional ArsR family regulator
METAVPAHVEQGPLTHPLRSQLELAPVLAALSDPIRLQIVRVLARDAAPLACGTIDLPVTKSTRSHHFRVLREAGVIHTRIEGRQRMSELRRDDLDARFPGLLDAVLANA